MIIIYDFDGTLTPYPFPQYELLRKCGYDEEKLMKFLKNIIIQKNISLYNAYFEGYIEILKQNDLEPSKDNICLGASNVEFNSGVHEYFSDFHFSQTGIKHYVVTSGIEDYVKSTNIAKYVDGIYGTTFISQNDIYTNVDRLLSDKYKVEIIKQIQEENSSEPHEIIYMGDGLTDKEAFAYVHSIGGKSIFVSENSKANENYIALDKLGIIDECFESDFSEKGQIYNFVKSQQQ